MSHPHSVVLVVFDELPRSSLLDERGDLDAARFPGFAAWAGDAIWYSNATSVSPRTILAVPSIVTGHYATEWKLPTDIGYPNSLFTLLAESHEFRVFEDVTTLCPESLCATESRRPSHFAELGSGLADLSAVLLHILLPEEARDDLPPVSLNWDNFWATQASGQEQSERFERFIAELELSRRPTLHYIHVRLPHAPWRYLPSGQRYGPLGRHLHGAARLSKGAWGPEPWPVLQARQRHLLQLGWVDTLLGRLRVRLKSAGLYDDALVVVTADHGISFRPGESRRGLTKRNFHDIIEVPLIVKLPGRPEARVDDRNAELIDILPTIADVLGADLPWHADGRSLLAPLDGVQPGKRVVKVPGEEMYFDFPLPEPDGLSLHLRGDGFYDVGIFQSILGKSLSELSVGPLHEATAFLDFPSAFSEVDPAAPEIPAFVSGRIRCDECSGIETLAISVNGVVRAITQLDRKPGEILFSAVLPPSSLDPGANLIDVLSVASEAGGVALHPLNMEKDRYAYRRTDDGSVEFQVDGKPTRLDSRALSGSAHAEVGEDGRVRVRGWAVTRTEPRVPAAAILVFQNEVLVRSMPPNVKRPGLVKLLGEEGVIHSGFYIVLDFPEGTNELEFEVFAVAPNGVAKELFDKGAPITVSQAN